MRVVTELSELDVPLIHEFLSNQSTWAKGISFSLVEQSLRHSLCFGGFIDSQQVAFARVISDYTTFANLVDVFVVPQHRGKGYGKILMQAVVSHPQLQGLRRFTLATSDSHRLYAQFGFKPIAKPDSFMERYAPDIYS